MRLRDPNGRALDSPLIMPRMSQVRRVDVIDASMTVLGVSSFVVERSCAAAVDETKHRLPVWKHQMFTDGADEWVSCA